MIYSYLYCTGWFGLICVITRATCGSPHLVFGSIFVLFFHIIILQLLHNISHLALPSNGRSYMFGFRVVGSFFQVTSPDIVFDVSNTLTA